jgi:hypothetical protein
LDESAVISGKFAWSLIHILDGLVGRAELDPPYECVRVSEKLGYGVSVSDFEGSEFAGGGADVDALVADVVGEAVADFFEEGVDFTPLALGD